MATPTAGLDPEVIELRAGVTWDTYVRLNDEIHTNAVRLTYHQGNLEIMTVSRRHEGINRLISDLFSNLAEGLEVEFYNAGGTTHRGEESQTGFEPDTCFYVTNLDYPFGDDGPTELPRDPAPDLVIEVDISRSSLKKMSAYAAVGCREGWRHHSGRLTIFALTKGGVRELAESAVLPGVRADDLNMLLATAREMPRIKWPASIRAWARAHRRQS